MKKLIIIVAILITAFGLNAQSPWTQKTDMPTVRLGSSSIALDGQIYTIGGIDLIHYPWGLGLRTTEMYDPNLDSW